MVTCTACTDISRFSKHRPTHHGAQHAGHIDGVPPGGAILVGIRNELWVGVQDHQTDVQDIWVKLQMCVGGRVKYHRREPNFVKPPLLSVN